MVALPSLGLTARSRIFPLARCRPGSRRSQYVRCKAKGYFPHHRVHLTSGGAAIPQLWSTTGTWQGRGVRSAPEPATYTSEQLAELLKPEQWQLAYGSVLEAALARLQLAACMLTEAYEQAIKLWQHVVASLPLWTASFYQDMEYLAEYTLGVLPAWLFSMQAALHSMCCDIKSSIAVQQLVNTAANAARDVSTNVGRLHQAVASTCQLAVYRLAHSPPLQQLTKVIAELANKESTGAATNVARGLTHSMAVLTAADLVVTKPISTSDCGRSVGHQELASIADGHNQSTGDITSRLQLMGLLSSDRQQGVRSGRETGSLGVQQMLIEPLQHAGFISSSGRGPTLAGVIAAASVVLATSVYHTVKQQAQQAEERLLQQVQLQMKAESLAAQRARFRRALDDSQAASAAGTAPAVSIKTRRRAPSPVELDDWEDSLANSSPLMPSAKASGGRHAVIPELDADAAREYQRFMAGAKAVDVPMWDSHMVEDLPKMSMKELQRQTQKIRQAATEDERAAMEDAESRRQLVEQQLNSQLAELQGAPIGRAAREKWRKEQQQKQLERQKQQAEQQVTDDAGRSTSKAGARNDDFNPFAISTEARAKWDAEDHLYSEPAAGARKGSSGGWGFGGFGKRQPQQQPNTEQQQQPRRRKFADEPAGTGPLPIMGEDLVSSTTQCFSSEASSYSQQGTVSKLGEQQLQQSDSTPAAVGGPAEGTPDWEAKMREEMLRSGAARRARRQQAMQQQQQQQVELPAAEAAVGPAEGSPEWEAKIREGMLQSGAARRARRQQMQQQQGSHGTSNVADLPQQPSSIAAVPRSLSDRSLLRPNWPGADARSSQAESDRQLLEQDELSTAAALTSSSTLAAVSAKDAQSVTAPAVAPGAGDLHRLQEAAAATAEAAAEARAAASSAMDIGTSCRISSRSGSRSSDRNDGDDNGNPFAVSKVQLIDDDTAFELGKAVDDETKRIRLQF